MTAGGVPQPCQTGQVVARRRANRNTPAAADELGCAALDGEPARGATVNAAVAIPRDGWAIEGTSPRLILIDIAALATSVDQFGANTQVRVLRFLPSSPSFINPPRFSFFVLHRFPTDVLA